MAELLINEVQVEIDFFSKHYLKSLKYKALPQIFDTITVDTAYR